MGVLRKFTGSGEAQWEGLDVSLVHIVRSSFCFHLIKHLLSHARQAAHAYHLTWVPWCFPMYNGENKMPKIENWRDDSEGKGICHKAEDLCLIPRTHMVGERTDPPKCVL